MSRITIQGPSIEIVERLRSKGVSHLGNRYLTAAHILDKSGVIDHLITMYENGVHEQTSLLDMIEKSVEIGRIISGQNAGTVQVTTEAKPPEPIEEPPAPKFGA